jgi:hypothetical protein
MMREVKWYKSDKIYDPQTNHYFGDDLVLLSDHNAAMAEKDLLIAQLAGALKETRPLIVAMDDWNKRVRAIIGTVPNTGFERSGDILSGIDAALSSVSSGGIVERVIAILRDDPVDPRAYEAWCNECDALLSLLEGGK